MEYCGGPRPTTYPHAAAAAPQFFGRRNPNARRRFRRRPRALTGGAPRERMECARPML
jgi:hypothetical protein